MKIGVVGCGALGSFYGAKLLATGEEVHFLLRSGYEAVRQRGVRITSFAGDFHVWPTCATRPEAIGVCDLVLIGLKTTANAEFSRLLPPLIGPETVLLTLQNGLGNEEQLAARFGGARVMGGLCFVCLNRLEPGFIQHIAHGRVVLGEYQRRPEARTETIAGRFRDSGIACEVTQNLERAHWEKLVWNIPFNGLGVASAAGYEAVATGVVPDGAALEPCLTTDWLLGEPRWAGLVRELMKEVMAAANALGLGVAPELADALIEQTRAMGAYRPSTLIDFQRGQALEIESLFTRPWRLARQSGVATPRLAALCRVLQRLDPAAPRV